MRARPDAWLDNLAALRKPESTTCVRKRLEEAFGNVIKRPYSTSTLDIVIEYRYLCTFLVSLEVVEGVLSREIFKLDKDLREDVINSLHEFVHEGIHFSVSDPLLSKAEIERIFQVLGIVGTKLAKGKLSMFAWGGKKSHIEANGQGRLR